MTIKIFILLCIVSFVLLACSAISPSGAGREEVVMQWEEVALQGTTVAPQGVTEIGMVFDKTHISLKITTHEVDIGGAVVESPERNLSGCTYSKIPCSLVDYLEISINGHWLFVARSVYADLSDLGKASLRQGEGGDFELVLIGGNASESYTVCITFDKNRIKKRIMADNESAEFLQQTTYFESDS
jgi:hypothetical protein